MNLWALTLAGLAAMLAHYITGQAGDNTVELVATTVDTRETLIQNGTVDAVFATVGSRLRVIRSGTRNGSEGLRRRT